MDWNMLSVTYLVLLLGLIGYSDTRTWLGQATLMDRP